MLIFRTFIGGSVNYFWENYTDEELLDLKLSDLGLTVEKSWAFPLVKRLHKEIGQKGLNFKPHTWVSDDWFSPDGVPGIAIPFFALHPRLMGLERAQIGFCEGSTERSFMKLLRHEAGHAIDNAFKLRGKKGRVGLFGRSSDPYPDSYTYRPYSKAFVRHLGEGYAQAHPEEDWAETFAVWLTPKSSWRKKYQGQKALEKLKYVDLTMKGLKGLNTVVKNKKTVDSLADSSLTLREYYRRKALSKRVAGRPFFGKKLKKVFSPIGKTSGESLLKLKKSEVRRLVSQKTGLYQYEVEPMLKDLLKESKSLYIKGKKPEVKIAGLLAAEAKRFKRQGRHRIIM